VVFGEEERRIDGLVGLGSGEECGPSYVTEDLPLYLAEVSLRNREGLFDLVGIVELETQVGVYSSSLRVNPVP
jgi:hypothetical protein